MDIHIVPGVKARDVAEAHRKDLLHQEEYECKCMTYWIDEQRENIFCLIEAPNREAVEEMHNNAHGLIPNKVIEVSSTVVESFLGRIYDPPDAEVAGDLKIFSDSGFRVLLVTRFTDPVLLQHSLGSEKAGQLQNTHNRVVRKQLAAFDGREVEHEGTGFIISFTSATRAVSCALAIREEMPADEAEAMDFRMGISAGEPVENSNRLFGDTLQLASCLTVIAKSNQLALASSVKDLVAKDYFQSTRNHFLVLQPQDENLLKLLFTKLEENWQNPEFDIDDYCHEMAMSKSQLYRKTITLTGLSPNILLKQFRLEKAKELMKKKCYTISQVTFDSGFTSPSYFTKCFKTKYGLLPVSYLELLP
ncbi:MAG TPA: nickel-binding protein [Chitinophagaceae bacterium]|nr:nickel-binding protein [Chitinophagaceae bacterium]